MKQQKTSRKSRLSNSQVSEYTRQYIHRRPLQEEFSSKVVELLKALLHVQNVEAHLIESRTKELESFQEKISRSSKSYQDPLEEITDLSGIRIIVYYERDLNIISDLIENEFAIDWSNSVDKRKGLRPEEFGYQSIHYIVKLSESRRNLLEWHHLAGLQAEIQVRTVLQHAWAAISHKLQYKQEEDVPQIFRRRLFRLSALLELADEEFMALRDKTDSLTQVIEDKLAEGNTDLEINILTIDEFLNTSSEVRELVAQAKQAGFHFRGSDQEDEEQDSSELVAFCNLGKLKVISDFKAVLKESLKWSYQYLLKLRKQSSTEWGATPGFICVLILIKVYRNKITLPYLLEKDWAESIATRVLHVASEQ